MPDEMFFTKDERSLRRGKRVAQRTDTCRPCLLHVEGYGPVEGVVLDVTPYGMLVRSLETVPRDASVSIQFVRDDAFREPVSKTHEGKVVRHTRNSGSFIDHGIQLDLKDIRREEKRPNYKTPSRVGASMGDSRSRMKTVDFILGGRERGGR